MDLDDLQGTPTPAAGVWRTPTLREAYAWLRHWLGGPWLRYQVAAITFAVLFPTLWSGLSMDDFAQRLVVEQRTLAIRAPLDLFNLISPRPELRAPMRELGSYFWWIGADTKIDYWRPLAALTHFVDYSLWPRWAWLMHLENLVWYAALVVACGVFYRRFVAVAWIAGLATALYAFDQFHAAPIAWIANRNALMSTLFGVLSVLAHDGWRRGRRPALALAAPLLLVLALLSAESGVAILGYTIAYAACLDRGPRWQRVLSIVPSLLVIAAWRLVYASLGHGIAGSGVIADPLVNPGLFALRAAQSIPVQIMSTLFDVSVDSVMSCPGVLVAVALAAIAILAAAGYALTPLLRRDKTARFFAAGLVLSALPLGSTVPTDRYLFWVGLGSMGLIAKVAEALDDPASEMPKRRSWAWAYGLLLFGHCVLSPMSFPFRAGGPALVQYDADRIAATLPDGPDTAHQTVVVLNAPFDMLAGMLPILRVAKRAPIPAHLYFLYTGTEDIDVSRTDANTLDIRSKRGWLYDVGNRGGRSAPFRIGESVDLAQMRTQVRGLTEDGRADDVRFSFLSNLDDPSLIFMAWGSHGLERRAPPPVGGEMTVPKAPIFETAVLIPRLPQKATEPD